MMRDVCLSLLRKHGIFLDIQLQRCWLDPRELICLIMNMYHIPGELLRCV